MEYDSDENFLEFIGPDQEDANHSMEEDEALLDEGDEEDDDGGDEEDDGEGGEEASGEYEDSREEQAGGGEGVVAGAEGENSAAVAEDGHEAAAVAPNPTTAVADTTAQPAVGNVEVGEAVGGETGMEGGYGGQEGGVVPGIEVGERRDGEDAGLSDGDFDEDDLVLEEDGDDELDSRLKPDHRFFAVRALVEGGKTARKLNRRLKVQAGKDDGFLVKGDERFFRNFNDSSIEKRVNMSASFQYNGTCHTCLNGPHDAWQGRDGQPVVMVVGDHHFPANIPAREDGECIRILRVENGSLAEITGELVRLSPRGGLSLARLSCSDPL
jgi:hypothetical protein